MNNIFGASGFGGVATLQNGTTVKFNPPSDTDTMLKNGISINISTKHQCITAMTEYDAKSLEELRFEDYAVNRKCKQLGGTSLFGPNTAAAQPSCTWSIIEFRKKYNMRHGFDGDAAPQNGTIVKFNPPSNTETMLKNGICVDTNTLHQCITAMTEYSAKSLEELRFEDYTAKRKGKQGGASLYGTNSSPNDSMMDFQTFNGQQIHVVQPYKWYWQNQQGNWVEYGEQGSEGHKSYVSGVDIEQNYLENKDGQLSFQAGKNTYVIYFSKMIQKNIKYVTERKICRSLVQPPPSPVLNTIPQYQKAAANNIHYQVITISESGNTAAEYQQIATLFKKTMTNRITSISRIRNSDLKESYDLKKKKLQKRSPETQIKEKQLFHGTRNELINAICEQGFDFRVSGSSVGTAFGKGAYFARDSAYSAKFAKKTNKMFVARVLVGDYAQGHKSYSRPPPIDQKNPYGDLYDSCVDNMINPNMFIVFSQEQAYPEYLIEYQ